MLQPLSKFIFNDDQAIFYHRRKQLINTSNPQAFELRMVRQDESAFWARVNMTDFPETAEVPGVRVVISDITDFKQAEESLRRSELRESENRFRKLFKQSSAVMLIQEPVTRKIIDANTAAVQFYGWPLEQLRQMRIQDICSLSPKEINTFILKAETIGSVSFESRHRTAGGTVRNVEVFTSKIESREKNFFFSIIHDITERRQAEQALFQSERRLRLFIEHAPVALAMFDCDMRYLRASNRWSTDYGLRDRDLLGLSHYDVFPEIPELWKEYHQRGLAGEVLQADADRFIRVDGSEQWVRWEIRPWYTKTENVGGIIIFTEDITEQKRKEEHLRKLNRTLRALTHSSEAMMRATEEAEYLYEVCNIVVEDCGHKMVWIGYAENNADRSVRPMARAGFDNGYIDKLHITWADCEHGRGSTGMAIRTGKMSICRNMLTDPKFAPWREEALKRGYASSIVFPLIIQNRCFGAINIYSSQPDPFTEDEVMLLTELADNLAYGIMAIRLQVESQQSKEALQTLNNELENRVEQRTLELQETQSQYLHAEKLSAIGKLSASIAHEFNNPLQGIMSILSGLQKRAILEEEDRELLNAAISESVRIKDLIRSLQEFNRPTSGKKVMMDVSKSLNSLLLLCKSDLRSKRISVVVNYAEYLPQILAVPDQIKQVFLNLLTNAADACLQRGGVITITTWQEEQKIAVAIKDTGIGIESGNLDRIFQPFYTTKPEIKGTGLGLSVCHGIVQNHHGEIRVTSRPGEGSTFTVLLPVKGE